MYFRFQLKPDANVLILRDPSDLIPLPKIKPWQPKDYTGILSLPKGQTPSMQQLEELYKPNPCFLDYEKMAAEGVDAIELQNSYQFRDGLDTWDCDCIIIFNPDVIEVLT